MACAVCEIIAKPETVKVLFLNDKFISFLEPHPDSPGHAVVAPIEHWSTIFDLPENITTEIFPVVKNVTEKINSILHPDGFTFGWNHGRAAGQMSEHLHLHIIPRWNNDGGGSIHSVVKVDNLNFEEIVKKF